VTAPGAERVRKALQKTVQVVSISLSWAQVQDMGPFWPAKSPKLYFAWLTRFRRLAKDYERLASTLKGMHLAAFAIVMLARLMNWNGSA